MVSIPNKIEIKGAKVHNLKNINVDIPLNKIVAISGVSGSGKSSLALGVIYAEGSRRYLENLSTYTRRRILQIEKANVDSVIHVPSALSLHQRPNIPGIRSTFGTSTELLNSIRLIFSRCGNYICPNNHIVPAGNNTSREIEYECPICHEKFYGLGAEEYAFNSSGACKTCGGIGVTKIVDMDSLIPNKNLTLDEGAVAPWNNLMWKLMIDVCREMGVRTNIPFKDLTDKEKQIVYDGPMIKKHIFYKPKKESNSIIGGEMDFTYYSAKATVLNALKKVKDEKGMARVSKYLKEDICPECHGTRLNKKANSTLLGGKTLSEVCDMNLKNLTQWLIKTVNSLNNEVKQMGKNILEEYMINAKILLSLGLGYLTLSRNSNTLSTGELQRIQIARIVRNRTTGVLYVLDEPSIGLHPANMNGLIETMKQLIKDGNSIILIDHDTRVLKIADYMIEIGPEAGAKGGTVIGKGKIKDTINNKKSLIGPYLSNKTINIRSKIQKKDIFKYGKLSLKTDTIHTVKPLEIEIPKKRLITITGVSGSGKTTLILESLYPAIKSYLNNEKLPQHIINLNANWVKKINLIDATPIGNNVRSTIATYSGVFDEIRKLYEKISRYNANDFSYNTGKLRCPVCDGKGSILLDIQFLPDVETKCEACHGTRYNKNVDNILYENYSIKDVMNLTIKQAISIFKTKKIKEKLQILNDLGVGYLTLGEATPDLSGGEAQRLKLASEIGKIQEGSIFIFDEPSIGLHPKDVEILLEVFQKLIDNGATVIVIEHDLDIIKNSDYIIDMGPEGGLLGGTIVAKGNIEDIKNEKNSITGKFL